MKRSQQGRLWLLKGFLDSPFQAEAMGEGTCVSPEQALLNATSLGPKFKAFQPESWSFSLS